MPQGVPVRALLGLRALLSVLAPLVRLVAMALAQTVPPPLARWALDAPVAARRAQGVLVSVPLEPLL